MRQDAGAVVIADRHRQRVDRARGGIRQAHLLISCEKPIDLSLARPQACETAVRRAGVVCMLGSQRRFDPTFAEAKDRLERGEVGVPDEMLVITSGDPGAPPAHYLKGSGGIFRDMLIHDFEVFRWMLCGDGDAAESLHTIGSMLVDSEIAGVPDVDSRVVTVRTRRGRLAQINASRRAAYGYDQRVEVLGLLGMLQCGNRRPSEVVQSDARGTHADNPEPNFLQATATPTASRSRTSSRCCASAARSAPRSPTASKRSAWPTRRRCRTRPSRRW